MELVEYEWDEKTEVSHYTYEKPNGAPYHCGKHHPLKVETPTKEKYWGELLWYLRTQGEP